MVKRAITVEFDEDGLQSYTDVFLATLWHVGQANPAPIEDVDAAAIVERVGREIIRRWLHNVPAELWHHQGRHPYWKTLVEHGKWHDGIWRPNNDATSSAEAS